MPRRKLNRITLKKYKLSRIASAPNLNSDARDLNLSSALGFGFALADGGSTSASPSEVKYSDALYSADPSEVKYSDALAEGKSYAATGAPSEVKY